MIDIQPMVYHPAKYSNALLPVFAEILLEHGCTNVLDPMAGVGKILGIRDYGYEGRIACNELEPEWAIQAYSHANYQFPEPVTAGDAADMHWFGDGEFDAVVTSPTYGNRLADHHDAKDGSRRYTYKHSLGRDLHPANTGQLQWGDRYRAAHEAIWREALRVLRPGGILVVNVKDHIRKRRYQPVSDWHLSTLEGMGCEYVTERQVPLPGMRNGANRDLRVDHEVVWVLRKPE